MLEFSIHTPAGSMVGFLVALPEEGHPEQGQLMLSLDVPASEAGALAVLSGQALAWEHRHGQVIIRDAEGCRRGRMIEDVLEVGGCRYRLQPLSP